MPVALTTAALNLGTAVALGALIGTERQLRRRTAGLRTNALVALGAASFVTFAATFDDVSPTRVAAQIVSGIGFLGAGIIFRDGFTISGLNTAATLWCAAAIGMLSGHGSLALAALVTAFVVLVNFGLRPLVKLIKRASNARGETGAGFEISVVCRPDQEVAVRALLMQAVAAAGLHLIELAAEGADSEGRVALRATVGAGAEGRPSVEATVARLSLDPAVLSVRWSAGEGD